MKVRKVQLSDLTESQAHKLRLLKAALEQVMGHEVQTMTLSSDIVWDVWDVH